MSRRHPFATLVASSVAVCLGCMGCEGTNAKKGEPLQSPVITRGDQETTIAKAQEPVPAGSEVDLVERVIGARSQYRETLQLLLAYYQQYGYLEKGGWVEREMKDLRSIPTYPYLGDRKTKMAARPGPEPKGPSPQADALYAQARKLHTEAGGMGAVLGGGKDKLDAALKLYQQLIEEYPTSDKIGDTAFFMGEIYSSDSFKEYTLAINSYQRCLTWNPNTQHPALFRMAVVYDYRIRNRDKAITLYKQVVQSANNPSNVRFAQERIRQLTDKMSFEAPTAEPPAPAK